MQPLFTSTSVKRVDTDAQDRYDKALRDLREKLLTKYNGAPVKFDTHDFCKEHNIDGAFIAILIRLGGIERQGKRSDYAYKATAKLVKIQPIDISNGRANYRKETQEKKSAKRLKAQSAQPELPIAPAASEPLPEVDDQLPWFAREKAPESTLTIDGVTFTFSASGKPKSDVSKYLNILFEDFKGQL
jgi:hypothetical protein